MAFDRGQGVVPLRLEDGETVRGCDSDVGFQHAYPYHGSGGGFNRPEHLAENLPLLVREQVPVAASLGLGLVPQELVDEPLIDPLRGQVRGERVAEDMPAPQHRPLRAPNRQDEMPAGVVYRDGNGGLALRRFVSGFSLVTEEHRPAGMIVSNPVEQHLPDIRFRGPATVVRIQPSQRTAKGEAEVLRVVRFRHDDDLGTALHGEWTPPPEFVERWRGRRREVVLKLEYPDGGWCDIRLLRTLKWIGQEGVRVGVTVFLDLSETGTRGWAEVMDILPCGPVEVGPGEMVTGTFKHSHGTIGELVLESETKPIGVTPGHLFWSEDRRAWVPVASLRRGETLRTSAGTTQVVSYTLTDKVEPVYNLEVEHDHCYRVGESGVLVHNQSGPGGQPQSVQQQCGCAARLAEYRRQGFTPSRMIREEGISQTDHYLWWLACNIAHAAGVAPQQGSTPVVSVALVCEDGSDKFR